METGLSKYYLLLSIFFLLSCNNKKEQSAQGLSIDTISTDLISDTIDIARIETSKSSEVFVDKVSKKRFANLFLESTLDDFIPSDELDRIELVSVSRNGTEVDISFNYKNEVEVLSLNLDEKYIGFLGVKRQQIFFNIKEWQQFVEYSFPEIQEEPVLSNIYENIDGWECYDRGGNYVFGFLTECITEFDIEIVYSLLLNQDKTIHSLLLEHIPTQDTTYTKGEVEVKYLFNKSFLFNIEVDYPSSGSIEFTFEKHDEKMHIERRMYP